jgi:hypothetical protein
VPALGIEVPSKQPVLVHVIDEAKCIAIRELKNRAFVDQRLQPVWIDL